MHSTLDELAFRIDTMPEADRVAVIEDTIAATSGMKWIPNPGPQTEAYFSQADVLLYGGQAAGGKSDLLGGLALMRHKRSLIMRRQYTDLGALIERLREIDATYAGFNGSPPPAAASISPFMNSSVARGNGPSTSMVPTSRENASMLPTIQSNKEPFPNSF